MIYLVTLASEMAFLKKPKGLVRKVPLHALLYVSHRRILVFPRKGVKPLLFLLVWAVGGGGEGYPMVLKG